MRDSILKAMIGQMIIVGFRGNGLIDDTQNAQDFSMLMENIERGNVGGVIIYNYDNQIKKSFRNVISSNQLKILTFKMQNAALRSPFKLPLFISVDEEGGFRRSLKPLIDSCNIPSAAKLGLQSPVECYKAGLRLGGELGEHGINVNFAPSVDLNINPSSPAIGALERSFGVDPVKVSESATAFSRGLLEQGIIPCLKHFPGHGSATADSHVELPDITLTWKKEELFPYKCMLKNFPGMVMVGHLKHKLMDTIYPTSLSKKTVANILREQIGWDGVVVSDNIEMDALTKNYALREILFRMIQAGIDIVLHGNNESYSNNRVKEISDILIQFCQKNLINKHMITTSFERISDIKKLICW